MFKVNCMIDDDRVGKLLRELAHMKAFDVSAVPVSSTSVEKKGNKVVATNAEQITLDLVKMAANSGATTISSSSLASSGEQKKLSYAGVMYGIKKLCLNGTLQRRTRGEYIINKSMI